MASAELAVQNFNFSTNFTKTLCKETFELNFTTLDSR